MSFLKKILPPEDKKFYQLFEEGAREVLEAANLYKEVLGTEITEEHQQRALDIKHRSKKHAHDALMELNNTFVTPIDREDILGISYMLNKIVRRVVRSTLNLHVYRIENYPPFLSAQGDSLVGAATELQTTISLLRKHGTLKSVTESSQRIKQVEHHGDEILHEAMVDIFSGKYDALSVIKLRDVVRNIESALDKSFTVSDIVVNVVLKNS